MYSLRESIQMYSKYSHTHAYIHICIMCTGPQEHSHTHKHNSFTLKGRIVSEHRDVHITELANVSSAELPLTKTLKTYSWHWSLTSKWSGGLHGKNFSALISRLHYYSHHTHLGALSARVPRQSRDSEFPLKRSKDKQNKDDEFPLCHQRHRWRLQ